MLEIGAVIGDAPSLLILVNAEGSTLLPLRKNGRLPGVPPSLESPLFGSLLEVLILFGVVERYIPGGGGGGGELMLLAFIL